MKKVISCMICALLLVGCMAGCGSTGGKSGSGNGIKIMMSLSQGDDFRNTIVEQAKKTAQEKGQHWMSMMRMVPWRVRWNISNRQQKKNMM